MTSVKPAHIQALLRGNPFKLNSESALAHARKSFQQDDFERTTLWVARALVANPQNGRAFGLLSSLYARYGQLAKAAEFARCAVEIAPEDPSGHWMLASALQRAGRVDEAAAALQTATQYLPGHAALWLERGHLEDKCGRYVRARDAFARTIELSAPGDETPVVQALVGLRKTAKPAVQREKASLALARDQNARHLRLLYAEACLADGSPDEAERLLRDLAPTGAVRDAHATVVRGRALLDTGHLAAARQLAEEGAALHPAHGDLLDLLALCQRLSGEAKAARATYDWALRHAPENPRLLMGRGLALHAEGYAREALRSFEQVTKVHPNGAEAFVHRAILHKEMGDRDAALENWHLAVETGQGGELDIALPGAPNLQNGTALDLAGLQRMLNKGILSDGERIGLLYACGQGAWAANDIPLAAKAWEGANAAFWRRTAFDSVRSAALMREAGQYWPAPLAGPELGDGRAPLPFFILGMPGAGMDELEQVLDTRPDVMAGGEGRRLQDLMTKHGLDRYLAGDAPPPNRDTLVAVRWAFLDHLHNLAGEVRFVTQTHSDHAMYPGLLSCLFPDAPLIHCTGDPEVLRAHAFATWYPAGQAFAQDPCAWDIMQHSFEANMAEAVQRRQDAPTMQIDMSRLATAPLAELQSVADRAALSRHAWRAGLLESLTRQLAKRLQTCRMRAVDEGYALIPPDELADP